VRPPCARPPWAGRCRSRASPASRLRLGSR
jgi:hypothetical protein